MPRLLKLLAASLSVIAFLFLAGSCETSSLILGEAFVAPATLHLHSELSPKSTIVGVVKHGDHLQIVNVQRRMVKVRTDSGLEGWVDSIQLLSPEQWDSLKQRRHEEASLLSQATATAYEPLNVHIDADRSSPAFAQIPEGGAVSVLGYKVTPKVNAASRQTGLLISRPKPISHKQHKEQQGHNFSFRPPKPLPPKPPENWQELSAERIDGEAPLPAVTPNAPPVLPRPPAPQKPPVLEDWTLIRTKHGDVGWVLSRNLMMSIPDEVAQYAEGKRITAFFDLGMVNDEEKGQKHNWLWTTAAHALPCDFDSWRVFIWNTRRHRYETSYRTRDLWGYFPVHVEPPDAGSPLRSFEITTKDDDGKFRRRTYTFDGHLVHLANTAEVTSAKATDKPAAAALNTKDLASKAPKPNWIQRQFANLKRRFFGS